MPDNTSQHYWNSLLASEGLSVWAGSSHNLLYMEHLPEQQSNGGRRSGNSSDENNQPTRRYVKLGGAGESQTSMFLELALAGISKRDQVFLQHYQSRPVPEVATLYQITAHACYCRINRIRTKLLNLAKVLENR
jgi:hypothetical protein